MGPAAFEIARTIGALVGLLAGIFITYWQITQRTREKERGLVPNPERCGRHAEAIKQLREDLNDLCNENRLDHKEMLQQLGALSLEVAKLGRKNGGGQGGGAV